MESWVILILLLGAVDMKSLDVPEQQNPVQKRAPTSACYPLIGCFSTDAPFTSAAVPTPYLPESPDAIKAKFYLYTRNNKDVFQNLDPRHPETIDTAWTQFDPSRETKFIVHGFLDSPFMSDWMLDMKDEFLKYDDYNVVAVDWSGGNQLPYIQASANTRVVGAQIALVINELIKIKNMSASSFHITGHSLGAHTCGYAGERIPGLSRISGLDPAGPNFDNTDIVVRLDPTDAVFVDVMHTDAGVALSLGLGMRAPIGHVDFFPNLGHDQPGCSRDPIQNILNYGFVSGSAEVAACNHLRAPKFFVESINSRCQFLSFPCDSESNFKNHLCLSCSGDGCGYMGFHADKNIPPAGHYNKYYLVTSGQAPFCEYHLDVTVKFSSSGSHELGVMKVQIQGDTGSTSQMNLNDDSNPIDFTPGKTYKFFLGVPRDIGNIRSVTVTFEHKFNLLDPLHWDPFGLRNPTIYIDEIDVFREEAQQDVHFCASHLALQDDRSVTMTSKC